MILGDPDHSPECGEIWNDGRRRAERRRAAGGSDHVVGCDFSAGMVAEAKRILEAMEEADKAGQGAVTGDLHLDVVTVLPVDLERLAAYLVAHVVRPQRRALPVDHRYRSFRSGTA